MWKRTCASGRKRAREGWRLKIVLLETTGVEWQEKIAQ